MHLADEWKEEIEKMSNENHITTTQSATNATTSNHVGHTSIPLPDDDATSPRSSRRAQTSLMSQLRPQNRSNSFGRQRGTRRRGNRVPTTNTQSEYSLSNICNNVNRIISTPYAAYVIIFLLFYVMATVYISWYISNEDHASLASHQLPAIDRQTKLQTLQQQQQHNMQPIKQPRNPKSKNVAVTILITKDPGIEGGFLDSAAALTVAIEQAHSIHNITLIALIHKDVKICVPVLKALGYQIRAYDLPFQASEVKNKKIGEEMKTDGCCGLAEALKLYVWQWTEFDYVLEIDSDVHFHKNFDELFEHDTTLGWTHGATAHINQELMNGGYLIVKPNPHGPKHFKEMIDIMKEGNFTGRGWRNSGIGWVYGGRTVQGILPYYYLKVAIGDETEFDRCKYNNMVEIDKCRKWKFENVTSNHFTWCQKPWYCIHNQGYQLCDDFRANWWKNNRILEKKLGLPERQDCPNRKYQFIDYYKSPYILKYLKENGFSTVPPK